MQAAWGMLFPVRSQSSSRESNGATPAILYLSGEIESARLDVQALGLAPLKLEARDTWDPADHYWGEAGEAIEDCAKPIIAWGSRPKFEMEQLPGADSEDPFSDPIIASNDRKDSGDIKGANKILMGELSLWRKLR